MDRDTSNVVVKDLARRLVERAAPEELAGFETQAKAWADDPGRARRGDTARSDPLSHGLAAELMNNTPLAMYIAQHVVSAAVSVTFGAVMRKPIGRLLAKRRRGSDQTAPPEAENPLDAAAIVGAYGGDLAQIREAALKAAIDFGAKAERAELFADEFVAVLSEEPEKETPTASAQ